MREPDLAQQIALRVLQYARYPNATAEIATITAALASDATTHSKVIEEPPAALRINQEVQTPFTDDINILINKGKAGNLSVTQIISALDDAVGVAHKPGVIDNPFAHPNATPPIIGTVCNVTNGNWSGMPTSYTYQWLHAPLAVIAGATASNYTLVAGDIGFGIYCIVTAHNAQGASDGISNIIQA